MSKQTAPLPTRQAPPHRPLGEKAREIFLAALYALLFAWAFDVWHAPHAAPACENAVHFAVPGARPRCPAAPAGFAA